MYWIGLDAGSVAVKAVVLDAEGRKHEGRYIRHYGHPLKVAHQLLSELKEKYPQSSLSITGSAGKGIARLLGIKPVNEVVSHAYAIKKLFPQIKTIVELGGEDSKLIFLDDGQIKDFSMNSVCAAGTGSFLEQQAERLKLSIEEFSDIASRSERPSKIAGRCSVFAKSDMIHLQQIATPVEDIVAGLCFAVARNFKGAIARGRVIKAPVAFQGGVAANQGMVRAFKKVFDLDELFIPPDFALMGAWGAALKTIDEGRADAFELSALQTITSLESRENGQKPLVIEGDGFFERHLNYRNEKDSLDMSRITCHVSRPLRAYLGIDIGSISTNLAVIDEQGNLLAKRYLMTAGRPIEAVQQGLREIYGEVGTAVDIAGVGTTGSGRYMIAEFVGADIVKNEITAQATAALFINPEVDTIFEIGGQDSKYISLKDGIIVDFEMNKACAAGTGSFIEEQAEKLDISVKQEFAQCAFTSKSPCRLGERCTVFMENSLMANLQKGSGKENLLAGLAYSIVQNYINRVVAGKPIGETIFFQGGVAFNKAVVAAFEKYLDRTITVPPHHDVTGAIGMALIARDKLQTPNSKHQIPNSKFKGFELSERSYKIKSFECKGCSNVCEINQVKVENEATPLFFGGRCEKYDIKRTRDASLPDLFAFRDELLWKAHIDYRNTLHVTRNEKDSSDASRITHHASRSVKIGLPYIFQFHDLLPFWATFLWELGFEVIVSPKTNKQIITQGVESVLSEACFPIKVAHGHIAYLRDAGVDAVFVPSFINVNKDDEYKRGLACPHTQTIPYVAKIAINTLKFISPVCTHDLGNKHLIKELKKALRDYKISAKLIAQALERAQAAQDEFTQAMSAKRKELISIFTSGNGSSAPHSPVIVIVGRPYNAFDSGMNLEIPKKLASLSILTIPMDLLPLDEIALKESWPDMYWQSGQRIMRAARYIRNTPNLYAIFLGNFSCGPDSFILKYFKEEMAGKPFLQIEIDEHSADAGAVTRCEAFLDSIQQQKERQDQGSGVKGQGEYRVQSAECRVKTERDRVREGTSALPRFHASALKGRTIFLPYMADHAYAIKAAFEHCGIHAEVLPESDRESVDLGRKHVSGKECYPYLVTAGDMLKKIYSPGFIPEASAFFMPSGTGPCRFGQYNISQRLILKEIGLDDIPIFSPNQDVQFYRDLGIVGNEFTMHAWKGIIAYELLTKCLHETRPYERLDGDAETLYRIYHKRIYQALTAKNGALEDLLEQMNDEFSSLPRFKERKPLIGIIGEIFVRSHKFSNENLVKKIEAMGGEVWLAPIEEWIYYVNSMSLRKSLIKKDRSAMMSIFMKNLWQKRVEHKFAKPFEGFLKTVHEPETRRLLRSAAPYLHDSFEGETILSIGKAVDLAKHGASGIINAMPFGCMPGTIVSALLKAVQRDFGVPCINIPYDGTESPAIELQIEAFMESINSIKVS